MASSCSFMGGYLCALTLVTVCTPALLSKPADEAAPRILVAPEDQRVVEGGVASFFCLVSGRPPPSVQWLRAGRRLNTSRQRYMTLNVTDGAVLRIEPARAKRDDGLIECRAENGVGDPATASARMEVYADYATVPSGYPRIVESPVLKAVEKDRSTNMTCLASGDPTPVIKWLKDFVPINSSNPRLTVLPAGSLKIEEVQESDEGKYECIAQNAAGIAYSYPANLYVRVRRIAPHFSIPPESVYEVMPGGSANLTCIAIGSPMPRVKWRLGATELTPDASVPIGRNILVLSNIRESATYTCVALSDHGKVEARTEVKVKALPNSPKDLTSSELTARSVRLKWTSASLDPAETYVVQYKKKHASGDVPDEVTDISGAEYIVAGLTPHTIYELKVFTNNNIGRSLPSNVIDVATKEAAPDSPPHNVRARPVSSSTVVVQWEEPKTPNGIIQGYKLYYTQTADQPLSAWTLHSVDSSQLTTVSNLVTNRTYTIVMLGYTAVGDGPLSEAVLVKTQQGVPEQINNVRGEAQTATTIRLTWEQPETSGELLESYEIYYNDSDFKQNVHITISPPKLAYLMEDLTPNTLYNIRVAAKSSRGEGAYSSTISVRTSEAAPSAPPQMVRGEAIDSTSFRVTWGPPPPTHHNGPLVGYRVLHAEATGVNRAAEDPAVVVVSVPVGETAYVVRGAHKWTLYSVWVRAYTLSGDGPLSDVIVVQTMEDVPGEPRRVKVEAVNSTSISVQWRPPSEKDMNGVIRGYQIHYTRLDENEEVSGLTHMLDVMDGSQTEVLIVDLEEDSWYQVQLTAYTRKGDGERSRPKKVKTKGAILGAPRNLQLILSQEDPPAVLVTWQAPRNALSTILGYRVEYQIRGTDIMDERRLDADKYRFTTGFLDRGVEYEFRVSAKNAVDYGEWAFGRITTPEGIPAGSPLNVTVVQVSSSSVKLRWDPPAQRHRNGEIVLYELMYHRLNNYIDDWMTNTSDTWVTVEGLEPAREYFFQIRAYTSSGCGPWSGQVDVHTTGQNVLFPPSNVQVKRNTRTSLEVTWERPATAGVSGYEIHYSVFSPPSSPDRWLVRDVPGQTSVELRGLHPHSVYAVKLRTKLIDGRISSFSDIVVDGNLQRSRADRDENSPESVQDFHARKQSPRSVLLEWSPPKKEGVFYYKVNFEGSKNYLDANGIERSLLDSAGEKTVPKDLNTLYLDNLMPSTPYVFNISANFVDGVWGPKVMLSLETGIDAPSEVHTPLLERIVSESSVLFRLYPASTKHGPISFYYVVVVPLDIAEKVPSDGFSTAELLDVDTSLSQFPWIATIATTLPREFVVGDGSVDKTGKFRNRRLEKGKSYRIFVRSYVRDGKFTSSPYSETVSTDAFIGAVPYEMDQAGLELLWIVAPVCGAVVLILLLVLIIVFIRRKPFKKNKAMIHSTKPLLPPGDVLSFPHDPVELRRLNFQTPGMVNHPPIPVSHLADVIEHFKASEGDGFAREYESIEPGQQFTWDASNAEVNKMKNRYANVVAYDHSRVILRPIDDIPGSDYINANYVDGYCKQNAYIATQGPLQETFGDFWRMIWEQQCASIVMMTKLEERNRIKCDQYWPSRGSEMHGIIQVTIVDVVELASFTIRTFHIAPIDFLEKREVRQFQFTAWPDHGVPEHATPLLSFIHRVKLMTPPDAGPTVVHCSAGVGRTGTYIVIDAMLDRIQREKTLDVYGHVTCLRAQRNYMVQTEDQYVFIYDALLEAVQAGCTEVSIDSLYAHVTQLTHLAPGESVSAMELEFKKLNKMRMNAAQFVSASLPVNKYKNRLVNVLPYESTRVCLQPIRGVEGSDYINADFIDGYRFRRTYIATQGPLAETTEDFWRMLWEHNSTIVVMMTKAKELGREKCHQYWPEERSARYQYFVVDPVAQYNMPLYILREFKVTDARDGQSRIIRQFQFTDWPEQGIPPSGEGFIEFIGHVQKTKEQFGQNGPISVHCSTGVGRTGVFIALSIVLERMRYEGVVDMYQTVRMLRAQRPAMVQTEDQYAFCYRAAVEYLGSFDHYAS